jgi:hypothetical protein
MLMLAGHLYQWPSGPNGRRRLANDVLPISVITVSRDTK